MNIYLIGLRGSGKSTIGRLLARKIGWEFVDQDEIVIRRAGRTIREIFASGGEGEFRKIEAEVMKEISRKDKKVVATGGGVVLFEENRTLMRTTGFVVHLDGPADVFVRRITADEKSKSDRPALTAIDNSLKEMQAVAAKRAPLYEAARHAWISAMDTPEKIAIKLLTLAEEHGIKPV